MALLSSLARVVSLVVETSALAMFAFKIKLIEIKKGHRDRWRVHGSFMIVISNPRLNPNAAIITIYR
jgi:hypothetical protein